MYPLQKKTTNKVKQTLKIALKKSDFVEIRFDFLKIEQIPNIRTNQKI